MNLTAIARTHPHAAFVHGVIGSSIFKPLDDEIHHFCCNWPVFQLAGGEKALPIRLSGLNIVNPIEIAGATEAITTTPLKKMIVEQSEQYTSYSPSNPPCTEKSVKPMQPRPNRCKEKSWGNRAMELDTEKGASSWLTALPLQEQGFNP